MRWSMCLLVVVGCHEAFSIDRVPDAMPLPPQCGPGCECDDFESTGLDKWSLLVPTGVAVRQTDQLLIDMTGAANAPDSREGRVHFRGTWDMRGGSVAIEVPQVIGGMEDTTENYLRLAANGDVDFGYVIRYSSGKLGFWSRQAGEYQTHLDRSYDPDRDRFWRIVSAEDPPVVRFETRASVDEPWQLDVQASATVSFANMVVSLVAGTYRGGTADPGIVRYDNFALCGATPL